MTLLGLPIATPILDSSPLAPVHEIQPISGTAIAPSSQQPLPLSQQPLSQADSQPSPPTPNPQPLTPNPHLNLDPAIIDSSPVLQRWLEEIPNIQSEIRHDPSFRTRLRLGYSHFPSHDEESGFHVGLEDVFVGRTGITFSADYQSTFDSDLRAYGADMRYYILPLGNYVNLAPVLGYRHIDSGNQTTDGIHLGARLMLALSRTGAADISLTHTWTAPGTEEEVGTTTLSFGYAITHHLRLATDLQRQGSKQGEDRRLGISLEWLF